MFSCLTDKWTGGVEDDSLGLHHKTLSLEHSLLFRGRATKQTVHVILVSTERNIFKVHKALQSCHNEWVLFNKSVSCWGKQKSILENVLCCPCKHKRPFTLIFTLCRMNIEALKCSPARETLWWATAPSPGWFRVSRRRCSAGGSRAASQVSEIYPAHSATTAYPAWSGELCSGQAVSKAMLPS